MSFSNSERKKLVVIGAGPMGLAAAYFALRKGFAVEVFETGDRPGGMAAHFDFDGLSLERFYHFCCKSDVDTMNLLAELGAPNAMKWVPTSMGYFIDGKLYPFGDPVSLFRFPAMTFLEKLRYAVMAFTSTKRSNWARLDKISARDWFVAWLGQRAFDRLWRPLFHFKFFEYADRVSAAWVWQRIKRLGRSRRSLFQEELGYIEGGSETLITLLVEAISARGGKIHLSAPVRHIRVADRRVAGVETPGGFFSADAVISTVPLPYVPAMIERDAPELAPDYTGFDNVGVACVVHKLRRRVSPYFWVNISDKDITIPGFVEFSNLRPLPHAIAYVPYYMPGGHEKFGWSDEALGNESFRYLQRVNPALDEADRVATHVARLRYAQPVCDTNFAQKLPDPQTPVAGLLIADTSFYYPEDRGTSESIRFAGKLVESLSGGTAGAVRTKRDFVRFLVAGGIAAAINWLSRFAYSRLLGLTGAVVAAYLTGMVVAFILNRRFVFDRSGRRLHHEVGRFILVNLVALVQVWAITLGIAGYLFPAIDWHWHNDALAHAIGVGAPLITSYFGHRYFTFARAGEDVL